MVFEKEREKALFLYLQFVNCNLIANKLIVAPFCHPMFANIVRASLRSSLSASLRSTTLNTGAFRFVSNVSRDDVFARSIAVLKTFELKNINDEITSSTQFTKDLGMDSLDYNDALVALEEEFDVVFDDAVANEITTVGEAVDYISKNIMPEEDILDKEIR